MTADTSIFFGFTISCFILCLNSQPPLSLYLSRDTDPVQNGSSGCFLKGDRNLKLRLAGLLTSQWYYLITLLAAKQYYNREEPGQTEAYCTHIHRTQLVKAFQLIQMQHVQQKTQTEKCMWFVEVRMKI